MNFLVVRLGALGDIVHAIPAAAALRAAFPAATIDWVVDAKHRAMVDLVTVVDRIIPVERPALSGWLRASALMRQRRYDVALDLQGLLKSAVLARMSGAPRVIGFSIWHLREKSARPFYTTTGGDIVEPMSTPSADTGRPRPTDANRSFRLQPDASHVISKNIRLLRTVGVHHDAPIAFPLAAPHSPALDAITATLGGSAPFALLNPGAAWPNKRWPAERFGEAAAFLRDVRGLPVFVLWGPGEEPLAREVVAASNGAARVAPPTELADLLALCRAARLLVSGDTGPLHIAAAAGTPTVAIFGPTDPSRNGPWSPDDIILSRFATCECHYKRRCRAASWCLDSITVPEVTAAIQQRLSVTAS
jgi:ADP-heptose:LPS heptosyltransferase